MLCEQCKKNEASVLIKQVINGEKKEYHICENCAVQNYMQLSFDNFVQGFFNNLITPTTTQKDFVPTEDSFKRCTLCGLTFNEISRNGKVGCAECYTTFTSELKKVINNIQGNVVHNGKYPKKAGADLILSNEIDNLRKELQEKIELEEYEDAARLRDEIKNLKGGEANE